MSEETGFKDGFGQVVISPTYIERIRDDEEDRWNEVKDEFEASDVADKIHYSEIEEIDFQPESHNPLILIKTDEGWRRFLLGDPEQAHDIFKRFRYRYQAYLQNH